MILHTSMPSDLNPEVRVMSSNRNVTLKFWRIEGGHVDPAQLAQDLATLPWQNGWRASAIHGVRGTGLERSGRASGTALSGSTAMLVVFKDGCSAEEFDQLYDLFRREVMEVANN